MVRRRDDDDEVTTQLAQLSLNITVAFKVWSSTATYLLTLLTFIYFAYLFAYLINFLTLLTYFLTYSLTLYLVTYLLTSLTYFTYLFTYLINFLILLTYLLASWMMYVTRRRPSTWRWPRQRRPSTWCWATQWTVPRWRRIDMHTWVMMICKKITHIHRICTTLTCKPFCSVHRWMWNKRFKRTQFVFFLLLIEKTHIHIANSLHEFTD